MVQAPKVRAQEQVEDEVLVNQKEGNKMPPNSYSRMRGRGRPKSVLNAGGGRRF